MKNYNHFGIMLDCSRNGVMNVNSIKRWVDLTSDLGYDTIMLYTEDTYEVNNQPYFGYLRGRYTKEEMREMDDYAFSKGMELVPAIQTLAHLNQIFRWEPYRDIHDLADILLADDERTYDLIDDMFATLSETLRTKTVNIGMDEAHLLGRGKYQDIHGTVDRFDILLKHINKVSEIARKYNFKCIMWGDMFFRLLGDGYDSASNVSVPERIKAMIPDNIDLIYWDYYSTDYDNYINRIKHHNSLKEGIWFAGGFWSWVGFAPHNDFSIDATKAAMAACNDEGVKDVFFTMWGDNGNECSKYALLPSIYYASENAKGNFDMESIKKGFEKKYGLSFDLFMQLDLLGTPNEIKNAIVDPDKYMLYNDLFMGFLDSTVCKGDGAKYGECAKKLSAGESHLGFGYLFTTLRSLCELLELKFELGVNTRDAYDKKDKEKLALLIDDYKKLSEKIKEFYYAFRVQWLTDNKPQGFEIQDSRLGGLYFRVNYCIDRLNAYLKGEIDKIEELEERILDYKCQKEYSEKPVSYNGWSSTITTSVI